MPEKISRTRRPRYPMPADVRAALNNNALLQAYKLRPPYQRNDYIGWITRARKQETRDKRIAQMLAELRRGDTYMGMSYHPKRSRV